MRFHTAYGLDVTQLDIVAIDDNEHSLAIIEAILKAFRVARLRCFTKSAEAIDSMNLFPANILITDWRMGSHNGCEFVSELRHTSMTPHCFMPIIMLTANKSVRLQEEALACGATSFLPKPISAQSLYRALEETSQDRRRLIKKGEYFQIEKPTKKARRVGVA